jgi:hypothetical protein
MIILQNENILGLVFENFALREANRLHIETKNKTFSKLLLMSLNFQAIYKSIGKTKTSLVGHKLTPSSIALMPDGNVISVSKDKTLKLWDINNNTCIGTVSAFVELVDVSLLVLSDSTVITCSRNNHIQLWDVKVKFSCTKVIRLNKYKPVKSNPIILANGYLVVSAIDYNLAASILILDLNKDDNNILKKLTESTYHWHSFVNITNNTFASVNFHGNISIWDTNNTYRCIRRLNSHKTKVIAASDKYSLLISSSNSTISIFNLDNLKCLTSFDSSQDDINFLQFLPGGYFLSAYFNSIKFWDIKNYQCINFIKLEINMFLTSLLLSKDKNLLTCPRNHSDILIYNY